MYSTVLDSAIQLSAQETTYFQTELLIIVVQEVHISRLELQRWSLEFDISFSYVYIWDLGLKFG
jgi:hypothetical protein